MRIMCFGREFFRGDSRGWNVFDCLLVVFSILDFVIEHSSPEGTTSLASGMKTIKMLRIARVFRVFRFFQELTLLALMIADSMRSLLWALSMLFIITYVFAIIFTE